MASRLLVVGIGVALFVPSVARAQVQPYAVVVMAGRPQAAAQQPVGPGSGVMDPKLLKEVTPRYTSEAMRAKIQGQVQLEVIILKDGTVGDVTVTKSLDAVNGLDQEAIRAAKGWIFQPARLRATNEPVDYRATIELSFRISDDPFRMAMREGTPGLVPLK